MGSTLAAVIFALALAVVLIVTGAWTGLALIAIALVAFGIFANRRAVLNAQLPTSNVRGATASTSEASYDPTGSATGNPSRGAPRPWDGPRRPRGPRAAAELA